MEVVAPLRVDPEAPRLPRRDYARVVEVALRNQEKAPPQVRLQGVHLRGHLLQEVHRRAVVEGVDRIDPQGVHVVVPEPHEGVVKEEAAHLVALRPVQVHCISPGGLILRGEVGAEPSQVVPLRSEVVVNHVQNYGDAAAVAGVDQALQAVGAAVHFMRGKEIHAVVAPAAPSGEGAHRHELQVGNPEIGEVTQALRRTVEGALRSEGSDMRFVDHRRRQGDLLEAMVPPGEGVVAHLEGRAVDALGLALRARIRQGIAAVDAEGVGNLGGVVRDLRAPPAVLGRQCGNLRATFCAAPRRHDNADGHRMRGPDGNGESRRFRVRHGFLLVKLHGM